MENPQTPFEPPHPSTILAYGQRATPYDFNNPKHFTGFIVTKGGHNTRNPYVSIYSPILKTTFYAQGKGLSQIPRLCMVRARQADRVHADRSWRLGTTDLKPLLSSDVTQCNSQAEGLQVWGTGIVKISSSVQASMPSKSNSTPLLNAPNESPSVPTPLVTAPRSSPLAHPCTSKPLSALVQATRRGH